MAPAAGRQLPSPLQARKVVWFGEATSCHVEPRRYPIITTTASWPSKLIRWHSAEARCHHTAPNQTLPILAPPNLHHNMGNERADGKDVRPTRHRRARIYGL